MPDITTNFNFFSLRSSCLSVGINFSQTEQSFLFFFMVRTLILQSSSDPQERHDQPSLKCCDVVKEALNVAVSHKTINKTGDVIDDILDFLQLHFKAFKVSFSL